MSRRSRIFLSVTLALIAWFAVTIVWASRPLTDSVPVGKDADSKVVVERVECNTLFDSSPMDASKMPTIVTPAGIAVEWALPRTPCTQVHEEARLLFGINVIVFVLGLAAVGLVASRMRRPALAQMTAASA